MVTEDFVSFETAKLLKEKGFDEITFTWYTGKGKFCVGKNNFDDYHVNHISNMATAKDKNKCSAPTLQMAMKWLREVHNLHCHSDYDYILGWYSEITNLKETVEYDYEEMKHYHPEKDNGFSSPEEACEAAIRCCLENLI